MREPTLHLPMVLCGECRWFDQQLSRRCIHPTSPHIASTMEGLTHTYDMTHLRNRHLDCQDFQPVTWREHLQAHPEGYEGIAYVVTFGVIMLIGSLYVLLAR